MLACLGDTSRFRLALALLDHDRCVTELAQMVGLSQSCTTRHLQYLEREGLVRGVRQGKRVVFRLRSDLPRVRELLAWATSAPPEALARRLAGGDLHADSVPMPLDPTPPRRASRPDAAGTTRRASSAAAPKMGVPPALIVRPPEDVAGGSPPSEVVGAAAEPGAGPGAADMEDWLL